VRRTAGAAALLLALAACSSVPPRPADSPAGPAEPRRGAYYKDDGPHEKPPVDLDRVADAVPKSEPLHRSANRPYQALGRQFTPMTSLQPFRERGIASWYGRRYHGQKTSIGEIYDMYAMSAAHPTLPLPSYARVTSVANGRSVVVRVNDRGPFLRDRVMDLSYAAAYRLGIVQAGSGEVEIEALLPGSVAPTAATTATYLQLGAFSSRENAEALRERVSGETVFAEAVQVLQVGGLWRLQLGPYASQDEARVAADGIEKRLDLKPLLVVR
jgi:rare lipoprotein A